MCVAQWKWGEQYENVMQISTSSQQQINKGMIAWTFSAEHYCFQ